YKGQAIAIVGVTAPGFDGLQTGQPVDITFPVTTEGEALLRDTGAWWSDAVARVKQEVSPQHAQAEVGAIFASLDSDAKGASNDQPQRRLELLPASRGLDRLRRQLSAPLFLLL